MLQKQVQMYTKPDRWNLKLKSVEYIEKFCKYIPSQHTKYFKKYQITLLGIKE
jgi:hypothetical protein